jgi:hypothetical protein
MARPSATGSRASTEPCSTVSALAGFDPARRLEFRPDHTGEFDELVARFGDGGVFVETMSDQGVYVDFTWNDGLHCQLWITVSGRSKLRYYHESDEDNPPRFDAWGNLNAIATEAGTATTVEQGVVHEGAGRRHRPEGVPS